MRLSNFFVPSLAFFAGVLPAQAQLHGAILADDSGDTYLACTTWPVKLAYSIPAAWYGMQLEMTAVNAGTATAPAVHVLAARLSQETLMLSPWYADKLGTGVVVAEPGSYVSVHVTLQSNMQWSVVKFTDVWLLGPAPVLAAGFVPDTADGFKFDAKLPSMSDLVGLTFAVQAAVAEPITGDVSFTHPVVRTLFDG